jgi:hypothetical protein
MTDIRLLILAGLTVTGSAAPALAAQDPVTPYPAAYFADAQPYSTFDMLARLPGLEGALHFTQDLPARRTRWGVDVVLAKKRRSTASTRCAPIGSRPVGRPSSRPALPRPGTCAWKSTT